MNIYDDYQKVAMTTLKVKELNYTLAGVTGEVGELMEKVIDNVDEIKNTQNTKLRDDIERELGDALYYCAVSAELWGIKFSKLYTSIGNMDMLVFSIGKVCTQALVTACKIQELNKRRLRGDLTKKQDEVIISLVSDITRDLSYIIKYYNFNLSDIFRINKEKLASRKDRNVLLGSGDYR